MKTSEMNNEEFVSHLMRFSNYGALCQVFIIEAIRFYSEQVSSKLVPDDDETALINPKAWHGVATEISARIREKYEK